MEKQFSHILDLNKNDKVYPTDKNFYALFFTGDRRFFIYAVYTKSDMSSPELIEVDITSYMKLKDADVVENFAEDLEEIVSIIVNIKREAATEDLNVGQLLEWQSIDKL